MSSETGPKVLALHGLNGHGGRFEDLAARLNRRLICPDLRGHGRSTGLPPWSLDQHAQDVLAVMSEPIDVIGYSFGGAVAVHLAAQEPDRVKRLSELARRR